NRCSTDSTRSAIPWAVRGRECWSGGIGSVGIGRVLGQRAFALAYTAPVPLRPLLWGSVVNTSLAFVFLRSIVSVTAQGRRRWRAQRNACEQCGYPLSGLPGDTCPECGGRRGGRRR